MTILVGEADRMMVVMNLVFSDSIKPADLLSSEELELFQCETPEELLDKLDATLAFLSPDDNEELMDGRHLIGVSLFESAREGLTGREALTQAINDLSRPIPREVGEFMLVAQAVRQLVRHFEHTVMEYYQPWRIMKESVREALALLPGDSPAREILQRYA